LVTSIPAVLLPIVILLLALTVDLWVYIDAKKRQREGRVPFFCIGSLRVETPEAWFLGVCCFGSCSSRCI